MKDWLLEVGLKTFGPSAVRGAVLGVAAWLLAKNGALAHFGVISDAATHTLTIHWDQLSTASIAALPAILAGVIKVLNYHGTQVVKSVTQKGASNA